MNRSTSTGDEPWRVRQHLHLDIRDVGVGIDGNRLKGKDARDGQ